jgi:sugar-specific transcriptional regulator TrmB
MVDAHKRILELLQEFGLSVNAAKAYVTLLKNSPSTGYEISAQSAIPRSAIYSTLARLEKMGLVNSEGDNPKKYIPLAPSSLIEHLNQSHHENIDQLQSAFDELDMDEEAFDFWHLHGYRNLMMKMKEAIQNAHSQILLNAWKKEVDALETELVNAEKRGVQVILFSFCRLGRSIGDTISYNLKEEDLNRIWKPKVVMVVDHEITIMGSAQGDHNRAIYTSNPAITKIASNYIVLDITLAGHRLKLDVNPIVQDIMQKDEFDLDKLIQEANPNL